MSEKERILETIGRVKPEPSNNWIAAQATAPVVAKVNCTVISLSFVLTQLMRGTKPGGTLSVTKLIDGAATGGVVSRAKPQPVPPVMLPADCSP